MAISKSLLVNILVICWLAFEVSGGRELLPCIHKLLLCEAYLKGPVSPPAGCCVPLREMGNNDVPCLCDVFNNQPFLKTLNITQAEALNLAQTCGANTDTSLCSQGFFPIWPFPIMHSDLILIMINKFYSEITNLSIFITLVLIPDL